ncbi:MAG: molybdopterin-dependent oxidoreductase [Bacteroidota bacterium]
MKSKTENIKIKVDGKSVTAPSGITVLQAAQKAGRYIPTLCFLENLKPYGGCRLCIVEIKNMRGYPTACTTPVEQGMEINTNSPGLQKLRREILELTLSEHPYTCLVCKDKDGCKEFMHTTRKVSVTTGCNFCPNNGDCELQDLVDYLKLKDVQFPITYRGIKPVKDNPFYELDYNLCIHCGRCVRICNEERNSDVLAFVQRGNSTLVGTAFNESQKEAGCEYCGACVDVCPTGSISEKIGRWAGIPNRSTETTCVYCSVGCKMNINTLDNKIVNVGSKPGPRTNPPQLCVRGKFTTTDIVHHPDRVTTPLIKKGDKWNEVSWDEAINFAASNLERYRGNQFGIIGSAQDSIENNYVLQKFARKVMRSNNVDLLSSYPDKELMKNIHDYYSNYPPVDIDGIMNADTILVVGSQAHWSHPLLESRIRKASQNGSEVIVANTHYNRTSDFAKQSIFYQPGEEQTFLSMLLAGLAKGKTGKPFKELKQILQKLEIDKASKLCGVSKSELDLLVRSLTRTKKLLIIAGDGILRNPDRAYNFNALYNIQMLSNKPDNCRILFLLSGGNCYSGTLVGMQGDYLPGFDNLKDGKNIEKWSGNWGTGLSDTAGMSGDEMVSNIAEDGITALYVVGDIPAHPNFTDLKFLIQQNMFLTETSRYAQVFFPITNFTETNGHIINLEHKLKETTPVIAPLEGVKAPWEIISGMAQTMVEKGFDYDETGDIFSEINSFIDLTSKTTKKAAKEILPFKTKPHKKNREYPIPVIIEHNCFHYIGNILSSIIPDMNAIREEGILNLSSELAGKLKVKNGDTVQISTELGKSTCDVKIMSELNENMAYFKPNWDQVALFSNGLNISQNIVYAKINKM